MSAYDEIVDKDLRIVKDAATMFGRRLYEDETAEHNKNGRTIRFENLRERRESIEQALVRLDTIQLRMAK